MNEKNIYKFQKLKIFKKIKVFCVTDFPKKVSLCSALQGPSEAINLDMSLLNDRREARTLPPTV